MAVPFSSTDVVYKASNKSESIRVFIFYYWCPVRHSDMAQVSSCISFALHVSVLHDSVADHFSLMREDIRHIFHTSDLQEFVAEKVKGDGIRSKLACSELRSLEGLF